MSEEVRIRNLAPEQHRQYKAEAAASGLSLSAYLIRLIEQARKK